MYCNTPMQHIDDYLPVVKVLALRHTAATYFNTLQHTAATHFNILQYSAATHAATHIHDNLHVAKILALSICMCVCEREKERVRVYL